MSIPKLFRVTVEVGDLESATELYRDLFGGDERLHRTILFRPAYFGPES